MQKILILLFLVQVFFLSACSLSSPRDDVSLARKTSTDTVSETQDLNGKLSPEKSISYPLIIEENEQLSSQETDIWERIGSKLILTRNVSEKTTASKLAWFSRNQAYLDSVSVRSEPYLNYIVE